MDLDLSNDWTVFDNTKRVTVTKAGTSEVMVVENALRHQVTRREAADSGGAYTVEDVVWNLPYAQAKAFRPVAGSLLRSETCEDEVWFVVEVARSTLESRYRCFCKNCAITPELGELIQIERSTPGRDTDNAPYAVWKPLEVNILARIQEEYSEIAVENERKRRKVSHRVYIAGPVTVQAGDRVVADQLTLNVKRVTGKGELGSMIVLDAELADDPEAG